MTGQGQGMLQAWWLRAPQWQLVAAHVLLFPPLAFVVHVLVPRSTFGEAVLSAVFIGLAGVGSAYGSLNRRREVRRSATRGPDSAWAGPASCRVARGSGARQHGWRRWFRRHCWSGGCSCRCAGERCGAEESVGLGGRGRLRGLAAGGCALVTGQTETAARAGCRGRGRRVGRHASAARPRSRSGSGAGEENRTPTVSLGICCPEAWVGKARVSAPHFADRPEPRRRPLRRPYGHAPGTMRERRAYA